MSPDKRTYLGPQNRPIQGVCDDPGPRIGDGGVNLLIGEEAEIHESGPRGHGLLARAGCGWVFFMNRILGGNGTEGQASCGEVSYRGDGPDSDLRASNRSTTIA